MTRVNQFQRVDLECGGRVPIISGRRHGFGFVFYLLAGRLIQSAVAAALCRRTPNNGYHALKAFGEHRLRIQEIKLRDHFRGQFDSRQFAS